MCVNVKNFYKKSKPFLTESDLISPVYRFHAPSGCVLSMLIRHIRERLSRFKLIPAIAQCSKSLNIARKRSDAD